MIPRGDGQDAHVARIVFASGMAVFAVVDRQLQVTLLVGQAIEERYSIAEREEFAESTVPALMAALASGAYTQTVSRKLFGSKATFTFVDPPPPLMDRRYVARGLVGTSVDMA